MRGTLNDNKKEENEATVNSSSSSLNKEVDRMTSPSATGLKTHANEDEKGEDGKEIAAMDTDELRKDEERVHLANDNPDAFSDASRDKKISEEEMSSSAPISSSSLSSSSSAPFSPPTSSATNSLLSTCPPQSSSDNSTVEGQSDSKIIANPSSSIPHDSDTAGGNVLKRMREQLLAKRKMSSTPRTPTSHVRIDNFQRPMTLRGLLDWLSEQLQDTIQESNVWLNGIKTHCYIDFPSIEAATKCIEAVSGKKFPSTNSNILEASYTDVSVEDCPTSSEAAQPPGAWKAIKKDDSINSKSSGGDIKKVGEISEEGRSSKKMNKGTDRQSSESLHYQQSINSLDQLFNKTKACPPIYWKPARK